MNKKENKKSVIILLCIVLTFSTIWFVVPKFPKNEEIKNLLTKLENSSYWKEKQISE